MSRAFAPAESTMDEPGDKAERERFRTMLRDLHANKRVSDNRIPPNRQESP